MKSKTPASDPVLELEAFSEALEASQKIVRAGGMVDLAGLEAQVEHLCAEVVKTEGPLRLQLLPMLEKVIRVLGVLEEELRSCVHYALEGETAERRLRAHSAYGTKAG
ncbi:MAG TPA: hypothetical protein VHB73_05010 [Alphaproteobacteria bacterium]|nr:hypothetical protein [Alphaproteobacteria bacterium]